MFGFLGPNGAGKTTTIRTLLDLLRPTCGSARVFGLDSHLDSVEIHARVGNLPGEFSADPRLTAASSWPTSPSCAACATSGGRTPWPSASRPTCERPLGELSRGNRQKIGLIQAAFHGPDLLLLDEPTGGLDPLMQEEFLTFLAEEREQGRTVFLSSHELDEVQRACDRVGIIREGQLVAVEDVADITGRGFRHVMLEFAEPVDPIEFRRIAGVAELERDGNRLRFKASGDLDRVVKAAARHPVTDIELTRPTLEEIFLTYYGTDGGE